MTCGNGLQLIARRPSLTEPSDEKGGPPAPSTRRNKSGRKGESAARQSKGSIPDPTPDAPSRRSARKSASKIENDVAMEDAPDAANEGEAPHAEADDGRPDMSDDSNAGPPPGHYDDEDDDDDEDGFAGAFLGRGPEHLSALRALAGVYTGQQSRLRQILEQLKSKDPSMELIALQELSELLLMATEDTLAGSFSPDPYVKELVTLMQPNDFGIENPETMLLACRCLANMMEALPAATANVVYGGAVPVLCAQLKEIQFIDVAEQCLSTLEKISVEFPAAIVREGGLSACLDYLDFFATGTQRTAVTTAANCCRNLSEESFPTVKAAMDTLNNILSNNDQRVVEQGCICVSRIVQSFRHYESKLEDLMSSQLLQAVLRLLLPGTTNMIGANIHTMLLQVLAYTAKASPQLSAELFKMNVVDTLFQILTGVSPPSGTDDVAHKIDSVVIMQALIHRPKDQVYETLNVICELLPDVAREGLNYVDALFDAGYPGDEYQPLSRTNTVNDTRIKLLEDCKEQVKRFAVILLPTLTDAYSSTVNLNVRQKVLTAQLKMLSNLDVDILEEALRPVPYASYLASIFSQHDHASLVTYALQAAELLLARLEPIYRYQFYREGVISEIARLADRPCETPEARLRDIKPPPEEEPTADSDGSASSAGDVDVDQDIVEDIEVDLQSEDDEDHNDLEEDPMEQSENHDDDDDDDDSESSSPSGRYVPQPMPNMDDLVTLRAKKFIEVHEKESAKTVREKASAILEDLKTLAKSIKASILHKGAGNCMELFTQLAAYFKGDALESITSYELMTSGIVDVLLEIFSTSTSIEDVDPRSVFLEAFMGSSSQNKVKTASSTSPATPFSVLVSKLQDLLSRAEHFEVITVHQNSYDSRGSATSMLAKQLRLKLVADEDSGIPKTYRNIMVSIHAIATFKALDDYLRPRISLAERPRGSRNRDTIAAYAAALAEGRSPGPPPPQPPNETTNRPSSKKSSKAKPSTATTDPQAGPSSVAPEKTRRSSRRHQQQPPPPPPPPVLPQSNSNKDPVECADEERLSDQESLDENRALNAIVDDLEDEVDEDAPEPSAVSMEVASTGKVTARKDDGTRVATPVQAQGSSRQIPADRMSSTSQRLSALLRGSTLQQALGGAAGALSYAAALQSTPQDWHIEFSVNDQRIMNETTIYRVVHFNQDQSDVAHRTVWNAVHTIKFKRVPGPPPTGNNSLTPPPEPTKTGDDSVPLFLDKHPITSGILQLLNILHGFNSNLDDVLSDNREQIKLNVEPLSQFVNTKLTAKLNRQLEEPLIVASNCLPSWSEDLARHYPFLFPFETRHLFLQSTSFGYSRSMTRWQNSQSANDSRHSRHRDDRPFLGRLQRQKVRISRQRTYESAVKVMELYGSSPSMLEVEYFDEVGTGLGPTLEFYSTVSKEFSKKKLKMWRENESNNDDEYAFGKHGLFPAPMSAKQAESENGTKVLHMFKMLGKFVARSMLDSRIIDVSFNPTFFRIGDGSAAVTPSLGAVKSVDTDLARSLKLLKRFANAKKRVDEDPNLSASQKSRAFQDIEIDDVHVEDLGLDFTLPGYPIELVEKGAELSVTINNVDTYVEKVLEFTLGSGVQRQVDAFRAGFSQVFPYSALKAFTPDELVMLFGRVDEDWSLESEYCFDVVSPFDGRLLTLNSPYGLHQG
jgi:E3 ubiquitin-protein ligase TRIP12